MPDPLTAAKFVIDTIIARTVGLNATARAKVVAYFYLPLLILGFLAYFGGGLSNDASIAISELRTEVSAAGEQSDRRGIVVIAEPNSSEYRIPVTSNNAKIWTSLDESSARRNREKIGINQDELKIDTPLFGESNPVMVVVEGAAGEKMHLPGETVSISKWSLSSRRSGSLVYGVLTICSLALGLGAAVGFPTVKLHDNNASEE